MDCLRMCIVCKEMKPKQALVRIVKTKDGKIFVDDQKKSDGRGAYVCKNECIDKLKKVRGLNRAFKIQIPDEIYDEILKKKEH